MTSKMWLRSNDCFGCALSLTFRMTDFNVVLFMLRLQLTLFSHSFCTLLDYSIFFEDGQHYYSTLMESDVIFVFQKLNEHFSQ